MEKQLYSTGQLKKNKATCNLLEIVWKAIIFNIRQFLYLYNLYMNFRTDNLLFQ